ncbi:MAG: tRNA uridine-5-carboxymethylaminomethyl(34) synthesis GTPase MnmE [Desulfobacterales bacterium]
MKTATIAAVATPPGTGGVGIIKISGPDAPRIAATLFRSCKNDNKPCSADRSDCLPINFQSHRLYYGHIVDPETEDDVDEVLVVVMRAPQSYTREDVVEIQAHAGAAALRVILSLVLRQGARMAEPGEFTQRAFLNGRIDLTQAEAVIDIINARTETALKIATNQVSGQLKLAVENIRSILLDVLVHIEAAIDFPEDVSDILSSTDLEARLRREVAAPIVDLMHNYRQGCIYRDGLKLAIIGRPNVGKSSLLNCLLKKERAIVNAFPGTTRDLIEDSFQVQGVPVTITDTAGLHETEDPVEKIGIQKARECLKTADLILQVIDGSEELTVDDHEIFKFCCGKTVIVVVNKIDLVIGRKTAAPLVPVNWGALPTVEVSAIYGDGIDFLESRIADTVALKPRDVQHDTVIPNLRHQQALEKCHKNVSSAIKALQGNRTIELVALDIQEAVGRLDEILGLSVDTDIFEQIFSRFCIGK